MRILWHSNAPWAPTGYGQQTALFAPRLRALGHDVAISAFYGLEGGILTWDGMRVFPTDDTKVGRRHLRTYLGLHGPNALILTLMDVWVLGADAVNGLPVASWTPVDHDPLPPRVYDYFARSGATSIAMSRFGEAKLAEAGIGPLYVPHGIDTAAFTPHAERDAVRELMHVPVDAFVIGMVANNQGDTPPRKAFPQVFQAFAAFARKHDDAWLYLHCDLLGVNMGLNLVALAEVCGIPADRIAYTDPKLLHLGVKPDRLAAIYSTFDVLANPSYGEGFGIPIVEAQACGVPVIVTDHTAMPELCGAGWLVNGDPWYDHTHGAFFRCPSIAEIYDAFEEAYKKPSGLSEKARAFALAYDADRVTAEHWVPALAELARKYEPAEIKIRELVAG